MDKRIPVTLLTGFLGSGKTTLLNKLLSDAKMHDSAVIINELGETGLDHILAMQVDSEHIADNTVLLNSGCICCSLKNELADTMRDLFFKRALQAIPQFNRLVIETTGMADPGPILGNLMNEPVIESTFRLDAVVVTIDSVYGLTQLESNPEALKQAAVADVLLLTKTDIASPETTQALQEKLAEINPGATQHLIQHGEINPDSIIDVGLFDPTGKTATPQRWLRTPGKASTPKGTLPQKPHQDGITSFTVTMPKPLNWRDLKPVILKLCQTHGAKLLRLKGIIHAEDQPAPLAIHAVHFTPYPPTLLEGWDEEEAMSRIVIIGKDIDEAEIRKALMQI
ncbi:CobW family GTP-binding protein [Methylotenera mobilis]|uniref:Cobalamin synthesis protein P47K n=1 Tax=Methylotenera mobilis (strain JLW8 / ATCC BAA-1282 / DSM 17540) TaxID=583345 RepID=C6WWB2_METML|nr:GTP-binding protein [Methylotenera mobilis]ACT48211.1 cobalamin synthesis protein P47K [Methylotenera mobilis JLW8]